MIPVGQVTTHRKVSPPWEMNFEVPPNPNRSRVNNFKYHTKINEEEKERFNIGKLNEMNLFAVLQEGKKKSQNFHFELMKL